MRQPDNAVEAPEGSLQEYLMIPIRKWYLVISVLAITVAAGWVASTFQGDSPRVDETRTRLLIPSPARDSAPAPGSGLRAVASVEGLTALATSSTLLQAVIRELQLVDLDTGQPLATEQLDGMLHNRVAAAYLAVGNPAEALKHAEESLAITKSDVALQLQKEALQELSKPAQPVVAP